MITRKASPALPILDRFHILAKLNKAIDEVRAAEAKELAAKGYEPLLKHSRWCLLKRVANLTRKESSQNNLIDFHRLQQSRFLCSGSFLTSPLIKRGLRGVSPLHNNSLCSRPTK